MDKKHQLFILNNIKTLNEFSISSFSHLITVSQDENNDEKAAECYFFLNTIKQLNKRIEGFIAENF